MARVNEQIDTCTSYECRQEVSASIGANLPKIAWATLVGSIFISGGAFVAFHDLIEKNLHANSYSYLLSSARDAERRGDVAGADGLYALLAERYSGREEGLLAYAEFLTRNGRAADADSVYQKAVGSGRQGFNALLRYTNFLDVQPNGGQRAIEACRGYLMRYPDDAWTNFELGRRLLWQGKPAEAIPFLEEASLNTSLNDVALRKLGDAHSQLGRYQQAIQAWQRELDAHDKTESRQVLFDMALAYKKMGDLDKAAAILQEHLRVFPNSKWTLAELDRIYGETKNEAARAPVRVLLAAMQPAIPVNYPLRQFISLTGVTPHFREASPGEVINLECNIAYLDSVLSGDLPEMSFGLVPIGAKIDATPISVYSTPPRLGPLPVWRGDSMRQSFAIAIPENLSVGNYSVVLLKNESNSQLVTLCTLAVAAGHTAGAALVELSQPAPNAGEKNQ